MKPRYAILILTLLLALSLTACGSGKSKEPPDLRGQWRQVLSGDKDEEPEYYCEGTISDDKIEIYYYFTEDGSRDLFWRGSFTPPADAKEPYTWTSQNELAGDTDYKRLRYASRDETMDFTYKKGKITYTLAPSQALRMTATLERVTEET